MNSAGLINTLSKKLHLPKADVEKRVEDMVSIITEELTKNNTVSLLNLGNLEIKKREERVCVNPNTGKRVMVPPKLVVKFKTSPTLKEKLKGLKYE
ncbi:MAG: HU family DNA-binding protein [Dysgonamonadaceae bacterium]|jgi:DNA-binding protein HU-beta/integration host factor subunit alpha|nr:HU family DNA-binding protein [Dysgonamonadaceae bacterium]